MTITPHSVQMIPNMLNAALQERLIIACSIFAILFGLLNAYLILKVDIVSKVDAEGAKDDENQNIRTALSEQKLQ